MATTASNRKQWHRDTWAWICDTVRDDLTEVGFEVHVNEAAGELTVILRAQNKALTIAPISNTWHGRVIGDAALR